MVAWKAGKSVWLGHFRRVRLARTIVIGTKRDALKYQAFWCEENIWHLAQAPETAAGERLVLAISGVSGHVACWQQKAGEPDEGLMWDYHVVLATKVGTWQIWDLDSRLGAPVPAAIWLKESFPFPDFVPRRFHPRFAVIEAQTYVQDFTSDRSHMRDKFGNWTQPPPPWPAICGSGLNLEALRQLAKNGLDIAELAARLR